MIALEFENNFSFKINNIQKTGGKGFEKRYFIFACAS